MVRRILLISHLGPLFTADYLYTYLMKERIEVYTVGRIYEHEPDIEKEQLKRCLGNHLPVLWDGGYDEKGRTKFKVDMFSIFDMIGDEFDAIIECETANMEITDTFNLVEKKGLPYYYYKTELFNTYYNPIATHILFAGYPIKRRLDRETLMDNNQIPMIYFPFSFNPDRHLKRNLKATDNPPLNNKLIFIGGMPREQSLEVFKKGYFARSKIVTYLKTELNGKFETIEYTGGRRLSRSKYLWMISNFLMNLNVGVGCFNFRDFETIGLSRCLVSYYHPEYETNGFQDGVNCILFKDDFKNISGRIKNLLKHPEKVNEIGKKGYELFMKKHHPKIRVKQLLNVIYND